MTTEPITAAKAGTARPPAQRKRLFQSPKSNLAAAELPPMVVVTEPVTAAKAGAARSPAGEGGGGGRQQRDDSL